MDKSGRFILYVNFSPTASAGMFRRRLDGIRRYMQPHGFEVTTLGRADCSPREVPEALRRMTPAGCIAEAPFLRPSYFRRVPTVFFDPPTWKMWRSVPSVDCDETAVARAAFRELSAGLPPVYAVALYWMFGSPWAVRRAEAFRALCREAGKPCLVFRGRPREPEAPRFARLVSWVATLPPHCAVFAVNDAIARDVATAFRAVGRTLPHSATLVGANAADIPGDAAPALGISSVKIDFELSGYLAAKRLAARLTAHVARQRENSSLLPKTARHCANGVSSSTTTPTPSLVSAPQDGVETFGPLLVERRKSTRGRGRREPFVLEAVDTIRREACDGLTADAVIRRSGVSKRLFTLRFREAMGHSVLDEIMQIRMERVFTLLADTDMPIGMISDVCGFGSQIELRKVFRTRTKMSMTEWRSRRR